jgi:hypothetical protein
MGGFGSGRPSSNRATVEDCRSLDVNQLHRAGALTSGWMGNWNWTRNGERIGLISISGGKDQIVLAYRSKRGGDDWEDVKESIEIRWSGCRFGGERPYFVCPGVVNGDVCSRTVVQLYCAGRYYLCRHSYRLAYASQAEDRCDRALRRANKHRRRLGGEPGMLSSIPERQKGMWHRSYQRHLSEIFADEDAAQERLVLLAARLMKTIQKRRYWR